MDYSLLTTSVTSGQSYKHFTIVIYDPRVVIWSIRYDSKVVIYERKIFIRLATDLANLSERAVANLINIFTIVNYDSRVVI